jgi:hypothetical protein
VPDERHEAMRDLSRAREAAKDDLKRKKLLYLAIKNAGHAASSLGKLPLTLPDGTSHSATLIRNSNIADRAIVELALAVKARSRYSTWPNSLTDDLLRGFAMGFRLAREAAPKEAGEGASVLHISAGPAASRT